VSPAITAPTPWNYDVCVQFPGVVGEAATVLVVCTAEMPPRRYLIVQIAAFININFCEIEVYAGGKSVFVLSYSQSNISKPDKTRMWVIAESPYSVPKSGARGNFEHFRSSKSVPVFAPDFL